jgi:hypothetical protein
MSVFSGWKCCLSLLDRTGIRVFSRNIRYSFCLLLPLKTLRLLDAFRLLIMCTKTLLSLRKV